MSSPKPMNRAASPEPVVFRQYIHPHGYIVYLIKNENATSKFCSVTPKTTNTPDPFAIIINMDKGFYHYAITNFSGIPIVAETIALNFPPGRAEFVTENFPDAIKVCMFWAACFHGNVDAAERVLEIMRFQRIETVESVRPDSCGIYVREHVDFVPMIFGGLKMACYGKKYTLIKTVFPKLAFYINDNNASKYYRIPTTTQFFADSLTRRISDGIEIMGTNYNAGFASSKTLSAIKKIVDINLDVLDIIYKNNVHWLEIRQTSKYPYINTEPVKKIGYNDIVVGRIQTPAKKKNECVKNRRN